MPHDIPAPLEVWADDALEPGENIGFSPGARGNHRLTIKGSDTPERALIAASEIGNDPPPGYVFLRANVWRDSRRGPRARWTVEFIPELEDRRRFDARQQRRNAD